MREDRYSDAANMPLPRAGGQGARGRDAAGTREPGIAEVPS